MRLVGGHFADRGGGRHKSVAVIGYGLSALCKPLLLIAHTLAPIGLVLAADRTGKGLRTAPRDARISLSSSPETVAVPSVSTARWTPRAPCSARSPPS